MEVIEGRELQRFGGEESKSSRQRQGQTQGESVSDS